MLKKFKNYQEKVQYAKELLALFNSDARFKKIFDKGSAFPEKDFKKMLGADESPQASDLGHLFQSGKDIYSNLSNIANAGDNPSTQEQEQIDQAFRNIEAKMAEVFTANENSPSQKLSGYMQATNNTKVSKGVLPFVYSVVGGLEQLHSKIDRDVNLDYLQGLQAIEDAKEADRNTAVECAKNIQDYAQKHNMNPSTLMSLSDSNVYKQVAKDAYSSLIDLSKITDPGYLDSVNDSINKSIDYEIKRSDILRQNDSIANDGMDLLKKTFDAYSVAKSEYDSCSQKLNQNNIDIRRTEREIAEDKFKLDTELQTLDADKLSTFRNELKAKTDTYAKVQEYGLIIRALNSHADEKVSADYAEKVEAMKQYCQQVKGDSPCETMADMGRIISKNALEVHDDIVNFKKDPNYQAESKYLKNEEAFANKEKDLEHLKTARTELSQQSKELSDTMRFQLGFYSDHAHKVRNLYGAKESVDITKYQEFAQEVQTKKNALVNKNAADLKFVNDRLTVENSRLSGYADMFNANKGGLNKDNAAAKREAVFSDLNNLRNSSIKLTEQIPVIEKQEAQIYETGNQLRTCTGSNQLQQMIDKLDAFMPDPEKKGNSTHYMAMHTAITNAKNLFNGDKTNLTKENQLQAAQAIKKAARDYLTAKGKQIRIWPFSSNQRYARILNAQSLEKTATQMEDIVNSMTSLEAKFEKALGPNGKYNTNDPKYKEQLLGDIFKEAKQQSQPEKTNDNIEIQQNALI